MTSPSDATVLRAEALADRIKPILAGHGGDVQGAALMQLVALFIAGHAPPLREGMLALHVKSVREMVPIADAQLFGPAGHPGADA